MPFKSVKFLQNKFYLNIFSIFAFLLSVSNAHAEIKLAPAFPYSIQNSIIYYATTTLNNSALIDTAGGFQTFDLTAYLGNDSGDTDMIFFDISSTKTDFSLTGSQHLLLMVFAEVEGQSTYAHVPIGAIGASPSYTGCDSTRCASSNSGFFTSTYYTQGTTMRVGIYPYDLCQYGILKDARTPKGCQLSPVGVDAPGVSEATAMRLRFVIAPGDPAAIPDLTLPDQTVEKATQEIRFQIDSTAFSCSGRDLQYFYVPGDKSILVNTDLIAAPSTGLAPYKYLVVLGNESGSSASVSTTQSTYTSNGIVSRLPIYSGYHAVNGFTNSSSAQQYNYTVTMGLENSAGIINLDQSTACQLYPVQASAIQGFLKTNACFVATAAYGASSDPSVKILRLFRDRVLLKFSAGVEWVKWYYQWSPKAAQWMKEQDGLRLLVRVLLFPLVLLAALCLLPPSVLAVGLGLLLVTVFFRFRSRFFFKHFLFLILLGFVFSFSTPLFGEESNQPYIDKIRGELNQKKTPSSESEGQSSSFTERIRESLKESEKKGESEGTETNSGSYIERLKQADPKLNSASENESYTERLKKELVVEPSKPSSIEAVSQGKSELKMKRSEKVHHGVGFNMGVHFDRSLSATSNVGLRDFNSIYGDKWTPDISLYYEYQIFHSEWYGSLGIFSNLGVGVYTGYGAYEYTGLVNPVSGASFGTTSRTRFRFYTMPLALGLNYRFNLLRILRPYVGAGPVTVGFIESRNDDGKSHRGHSEGYVAKVGVSFLLDWFERRVVWDSYAEQGVKHTYLFAEYSRLSTVKGDVDVSISGIFAGVGFEL